MNSTDREKLVAALVPGALFDTPFEDRCRVTSAPDPTNNYNFIALDSEGVECTYSLAI
jgi:hypothetical protein